MSSGSNIEWTDSTWNPVVGCTKVSDGCRNCYAMVMAQRVAAAADACEDAAVGPHDLTPKQVAYQQVVKRDESRGGVPLPQWNNRVECVDDVLADPFSWRTPRRVFVNSMSDLFHEGVPFEFIDKVFAVMALAHHHTFQVLTKRPERMAEYLNAKVGQTGNGRRERVLGLAWSVAGDMSFLGCKVDGGTHRRVKWADVWPLPNVWLGVSIESEEHHARAWELLKCPAAVRFLSLEPLLGPVDLDKYELLCKTWRKGATVGTYIDWVIVGGESGPGARGCDVAWVRDIVRQCRASGVPCFVKQLGGHVLCANDRVDDWLEEVGGELGYFDLPSEAQVYQGMPLRMRLVDRKGGDMSEWPEALRVRAFPKGGV